MSDDPVWYRAECLVLDGDLGADALWSLGAGGVEVQDRETFMEGGTIAPVPEGRTRLIAFFDLSEGDPAEMTTALEAALAPESLRLDRFDDTSWQTAWKDYFHPVLISRRCIVGPPWESFDAPEPGVKLVIEPGLAFGTGTHETTQLVGQLLDDAIGEAPPATMLDVGCGSAILSMQARALGVGHVVGIDVDATAVGIAQETVDKNELDGIDLSTRPLGEIEEEYPLVVANILGHILLAIREELVARVEPGGTLLVSGVTDEQADAFDTSFRGDELELVEQYQKGEWVAFDYRRKSR